MASIYELQGEIALLWNLMEAGEIDKDALKDALDCTKEELAIKLEGYCKFLKNLDSDIAGLDQEIKRLQARKKALQNTKDHAKEAMRDAMITAGGEPMTCGTFKLSVSNNPPKLVMDSPDLEQIPSAYWTTPAPVVNLEAIKEALISGAPDQLKELEGIAHIEIGSHINIR